MTFSVVARADDGSAWGVAVASKFLAVGNVVPAAAAGVGAIATQASGNVAYKPQGLALLAAGTPAAEVVEALVGPDAGRDERQVGVVDADGRGATWTGSQCMDWAGGVAGDGFAIQGNILVGPQVVEAMHQAWTASTGPLAHRLLATLTAGDRAGGDRRGRQSAALVVMSPGAGYGGLDDVAADLRVDDHPDPVTELARLLDLNDFYLTASAPDERVAVDDALAAELAERVRALGHPDLGAWVGTENYEMRVAEDGSWIDRRVLEILRSA